MRETKENRIAWWRSDFAQGVCVFGGVMLLALFFEWVSKVVLPLLGNPSLLMISDKIVVTDLLVGVFTAQVTMITVAITFTGLLVQLFGSKEEYLGMSLREAVFQRRYGYLSLPTIAIVAITLPAISYYFVVRGYISALLVVFIINIWIVAVLLKHYLMYAISVTRVHQDIRDIIEKKMLFAVKRENEKMKVGGELFDDIYSDMALHMEALMQYVVHDIDEYNLISFDLCGHYILKVIEKVANKTAYPSKSLMLSGLMNIGDVVTFSLLRNKRYELCYMFFVAYHLSYHNRDKSIEHDIMARDFYILRCVEPFMAHIGDICFEMINDGFDEDFNFLELFEFLTDVQEFFLLNTVDLYSVQIVSTVFKHLFNLNKNTQSSKKLLSQTYIDNYYLHISSNLNSLHTADDAHDETMLLELYVLELTEIMLYLAENNNFDLIEYMLTAETKNQESISMLKAEVTPFLVLNMAIIIINEGTQSEYIENIKEIKILHDDGSYENVVENSSRFLSSLDVCKISHRTLYVSISQGLEDYLPYMLKHSIDVIIVYIIIFFHDLKDYYDIAQWFGHDFLISWQAPNGCFTSIKKELNLYFDNIKVTKYYGSATSMGSAPSFIDFYSLEDYFFENNEKIIANLYVLNKAIEKVYQDVRNSSIEHKENC